MKCDAVKYMISAYIDGELSPEEEKLVEKHVSSCSGCRKLLKEQKEAWDMLGSWKAVSPIPGYISRFWTKRSAETTPGEKILEGVKSVFAGHQLVYRVALISVFLVAINIGLYSYVNMATTRTLLTSASEEELEMMEHYDLIANLDLIEELGERLENGNSEGSNG